MTRKSLILIYVGIVTIGWSLAFYLWHFQGNTKAALIFLIGSLLAPFLLWFKFAELMYQRNKRIVVNEMANKLKR